nr:transposase [uncultured Methanolobus sp.]
MDKKSIMYGGIQFEDSIGNYLNRESASICQFLHFLCIEDISKHVERAYYANNSWNYKYKISSMIKLFIVMCFRQLSYEKTVSSLTEEEAILLAFYDINGIVKLPSSKTLHNFVKYRLGEDGISEIMMLVGERILKLSQIKEAKIDSTPLEASRYDKYADYNTHYKCKMDKAHITMVGTCPVFMTHTNGKAGDTHELIKHIEALKKMNADIDMYSADTGYKAFENHADICYYLGAKPVIAYPKNAVISKEGEIERINHWVNKMWEKGGDVHASIEVKLKFLYENGRKEQVGMYLRNLNMRDEAFRNLYKKRGECEPKHGHIKEVVKFDIRRVRVESRRLYSLLSFVSYQLLVLTELQNMITKRNSFGKYF